MEWFDSLSTALGLLGLLGGAFLAGLYSGTQDGTNLTFLSTKEFSKVQFSQAVSKTRAKSIT